MQRVNNLLKISAIINLLLALFTMSYQYTKGYGIVILIVGIILLSYSFLPPEKIKEKKAHLIIIAVFSFLTNMLISVLIFLVFDELSSAKPNNTNSPPVKTDSITTENKKIDLLLKIGLGMILVSGILFSTTSWEIISNVVKIISLILMGILFLALSKFSETRLKIKRTTKAYYILGLSFFLLTWVGIGYFGIISPWFSYNGTGRNLVYCITLIFLSILLYLIGSKFSEQENTYMGYASLYLSAYHLLTFFGLSMFQVAAILSAISFGINFVNSSKIKKLKEINIVISYLYWIIILIHSSSVPTFLVILGSIINIVNLSYMAFNSNTSLEKCSSIIISYILILISTISINVNIDKYLIFFICTTLYSLFIRYVKKRQDKNELCTNQIIYNVCATILFCLINSNASIISLLLSIIYLGVNILNTKYLKEDNNFDFKYQPIIVYIVVFNIINLIGFTAIIANVLTILIYILIRFLAKKTSIIEYYQKAVIILSIITLIANYSLLNTITGFVLLIVAIYLYITRNKNENSQKILYYIFILINILTLIKDINILFLPDYISAIVLFLVYGILTCIVEDKQLKIVNYIALSIPMYQIIELIPAEENIKAIMLNAFYLYIIFLIVRYIIVDKNAKDGVASIGLVLLMLDRLTIGNLYSGLYIGIVCIIAIFITFIKNEYKILFYSSVVLMLLNIIIQLWDYWQQIPFWLYLLLAGIAIVGFVTYKEVKKKEEPPVYNQQSFLNVQTETNNQDIKKDENIELLMDDEFINFCPNCGKKNNGGNFCGQCGQNLISKK